MITEDVSCFPNPSQGIHHPDQMYTDVVETSSSGGSGGSDTQLGSFLCSMSILKEKVNQVQSLARMFLSSENHQSQSALASMGTLIQEVIVTASSMMFNCQQMALGSPHSGNDNTSSSNNNNNNNSNNNNNNNHHHHHHNPVVLTGDGLSQLGIIGGSGSNNNNRAFLDGESFYNWYADNTTCNNTNNNNINVSFKVDNYRTTTTTTTATTANIDGKNTQTQLRGNNNNIADQRHPEGGYDIVELDAADLLAKYTHYCQVCGKGFKRDANLRMHMRAHGDEYKSNAALSNPLKNNREDNRAADDNLSRGRTRKYSCPQEGCRWNKNHAKFQPLKSMICVKNHYKRSHCPKMYVCKRCNRKQFSVLSDLRTHEKHCGDIKWQCSCGTTFSRKDKLMGHVALFVGHTPMIHPMISNKIDCHQGMQIQFEDR